MSDQDQNGGSGAAGGSGGSGAVAGSAGSTASGGSAAGPGGGGVAGASPDGGLAGSAGGPQDGGPMPAGSRLEACVFMASCGGSSDFGFPLSVGACLDRFSPTRNAFGHMGSPLLEDRFLRCAKSRSCSEFIKCYGGDLITLSGCGEGAACKDNRMTTATGASFDCSVIGATCGELPTGAIRSCCHTTMCQNPGKVSCAGTQGTGCDWAGRQIEVDCTQLGTATCTEDQPFCRGTGAKCPPDRKVQCDGSTAVFCLDGQLSRFDCSQVATRSACQPGRFEPCVPAGTECSQDGFRGTCDGTRLTYCLDGSIKSFDCRSLGFSRCEQVPNEGAKCR